MRVALYSRTSPPAVGGMERFAADLASWRCGAGHEVTVITEAPASSTADNDADGPRVIRSSSPATTVREVRRADVVQVKGLSLRGIALARTARRPMVVVHSARQHICPTGMAWPGRGVNQPCPAGPRPGPCATCPESSSRGRIKVLSHRWGGVGAHHVAVSHYLLRGLEFKGRVIHNSVASRSFDAYGAGVEPDPVATDAARKQGFTVFSSVSDAPTHFYGAITLNHVIEDVRDGASLLQACAARLATGGRLVSISPNPIRLPARWCGRAWFALAPPRHLVLYGPRALAAVASRMSLRCHVWTTARNAPWVVNESLRLRQRSTQKRFNSDRIAALSRISLLFGRGAGEEVVMVADRSSA